MTTPKNEQTMTVEEFMDRLTDGTTTTIVPFFMTTPREKFVKEVVSRVERAMKRDEAHRVFILFQEGVSMKKARSVYNQICARGNAELDTPTSDDISLEIVRDIPLEFLQGLLGAMVTIDYV